MPHKVMKGLRRMGAKHIVIEMQVKDIETCLGKEPAVKYPKNVMLFLPHLYHFSHSWYL